MQVWNQSGRVCAGPVGGLTNAVTACPVSPIPQEYTLIFGINFLQTATPTALNEKNSDGTTAFIEDMAVTTDPIIEAPPPAIAGTLPKTGTDVAVPGLPHADPGALRCHAAQSASMRQQRDW